MLKKFSIVLCWLIFSATSTCAGSHGGYPAPPTLTPNGSWAGTATACLSNGGPSSPCLSSSTYGSGWQFMPVSYFDEPTGYQSQTHSMVAASSITDPNYQICVGYPLMGAPTGTRPAPTYVNFWLEGGTSKVTQPMKSNKGTWGYCINPRGRAGGSPLNGFATLCAEIVPQNGPSQAICMELDLQNGAGATTRARNTYYVNSLDANASDANDGSRLTYLSPGVGPWKTALCHLNGPVSGCIAATQVSSGCIDIMVQAGSYINENTGNTFPTAYGGSAVCVDRVMSTASNCTKQTPGNCFTLDDTGPYTLFPNAGALQFIGANAIYITSGQAIGYTTGSDTSSSVWFKNSVIQDTSGSQCGPIQGGCQNGNLVQFAGGIPGVGHYFITASVTESQYYGISAAHMKLCRNNYVEAGQEIFDLDDRDSNSASFNCTYSEQYWTMYAGFQNTNTNGLLTIQNASVVSGSTDPICSQLGTNCLKIIWNPTGITGVDFLTSVQIPTATATFSGTTVTSTLSPNANQVVWFVPDVGSSLPSNISPQTIYYATSNTGTTFQICTTSGCGGGPITFTGSGSGTLTAAKGVIGPGNPSQICMASGTGFTGGRQLGVWNQPRGSGAIPNDGEVGCFNYNVSTQWGGTNSTNGWSTYYLSSPNGQNNANWDTCISSSGVTGCPHVGDQGAVMTGQHQNWYRINAEGNTALQNLLYIQGAKFNTNGATNLGQGGSAAAGTGTITTSGTTVSFGTAVPTLCNGDIVAVNSIAQYHTVMSMTTPANTYQFGDPNSCSSNVTAATLDGPFLASIIPNNGPILANVTGNDQFGPFYATSVRIVINGSQFSTNSLGYTVFSLLTTSVAATNVPINGWSICQQSSGLSCGANPVTHLTVGGVDPAVTPVNCVGAAATTCLYSDATSFAISTSNNYVMNIDIGNRVSGGLPDKNVGGSGGWYSTTGGPTSNCANGNTNASGCATAPSPAWGGLNTGQSIGLQYAYSQTNAPNASPAQSDITTPKAWTRVRSWTNFGCYSCVVNIINGGYMDQRSQGYVNWIWNHFTYANTNSNAYMGFDLTNGQNGLNNWVMYDSIMVPMSGNGFSSIGSGTNILSYPNQFFGLINDNVDAVLSSSNTFYAGTNMTNQIPAFAQATSPFGNVDARPTVTNGGALCAYAAGSWGSCPLTQQSLDPNPGMDANGNTFGPGTPRPHALVGAVQPQ